MRRAVGETWAQDVLNRANPEGQLPVNVPELELNFVALVNAAIHQLSNGGDQHRLEGWKHLLPDSEEEFTDVLETANVLHAKDDLSVDGKPSAPPGDETDAEHFAIWEDDDVAQEQEQEDEVAEEPVFAYDGPPHHVEEEPRPEEPPPPAMCKWLALRLVHGSASAEDLARARGHQLTIVEAPAPVVEFMQPAPTFQTIITENAQLTVYGDSQPQHVVAPTSTRKKRGACCKLRDCGSDQFVCCFQVRDYFSTAPFIVRGKKVEKHL